MARVEVQFFSREEEEVEIHGDILEAILLYVPLIDLVPASSVSKSWCSVVASSLRHLKKPKPWLVIYKQTNSSPYATTTHAYDPCSNQWIKISQPSIKFISALKSQQALDLWDVVKDSMYREVQGLSIKAKTIEAAPDLMVKFKDFPRPLPRITDRSQDSTNFKKHLGIIMNGENF
ncbi:F-box domain-containing protein [Forsythia ovata]|uniref:F-box domain-containing protein n=1 Tax=Forsythia ovata TaxID=205694 RepID=A0ABD1S0H0_9LAMI